MGNEQSRVIGDRGTLLQSEDLARRKEASRKRFLERYGEQPNVSDPLLIHDDNESGSTSVYPRNACQILPSPGEVPGKQPVQKLEEVIAGQSFSKNDAAPSHTSSLQELRNHGAPLRGGRPNSSLSGPALSSMRKSAIGQKRQAPIDTLVDERGASPPKTHKRFSHASPRSPGMTEHPLKTVGDERPPAWYRELKVKNSRAKDEGDADTLLKALRTQINKAQQKSRNRTPQGETFAQVREKLHKLTFKEVTAPMLKLNRVLHNEDGLPQLFDDAYTKGVNWPFDIRADAEEVYNKWCRRVFDTHLFRGIVFRVKTAEDKREGQKTTDSIDPSYPAVPAKYHGKGDLLNGQWWPTQLCALRDGAHGVSQGGISGRIGEGAYSCIMSGGHSYPDVDNGDEVLYCGTDSTDGSVTDYTQRMLESVESGRPIRLLRSHNLSSQWAPTFGFRYDGLYDVVSFEQLDDADSTRQRHRFRLVRQAGQNPIRGGLGPERRPTEEEVEEYRKHQRNAGKASGKGTGKARGNGN